MMTTAVSHKYTPRGVEMTIQRKHECDQNLALNLNSSAACGSSKFKWDWILALQTLIGSFQLVWILALLAWLCSPDLQR
eukprot:4752422-Amphidinium_carterae.1